MRVIPAVPITTAVLTASSVPESDHPAWSGTTAYTVGQRVIRTTTHRIYERLTPGTTAALPETDTANWLDAGPTNRWSMFDLERNSQTAVAASPLATITVSVTPGQRVDAIALMGLDADSVSITMTVAGAQVYSYTQALQLRRTASWSQYFFGRFRFRQNIAKFDLPPYSGGVITVTLSSARGVVKCGAMAVGQSHFLGSTLTDAESDRLSFSTVDRDKFGNAKLVKVGTAPKTSQALHMPAALVPAVEGLRRDLDGVPAVWSGLDDQGDSSYFESLLVLGIYRSWPIRMTGSAHATATITLEEI